MAVSNTRTSLTDAPSRWLHTKVIQHFWRRNEGDVDLESYTSYFEYYDRTCKSLSLGLSNRELHSLSITNHEDLLDMADAIWELTSETPNFDRPQVRAALMKLPCHAGQPPVNINNSINLLLRLWLTVRIQEADFSPAAKTIQWDDILKIQDFIARIFSEPQVYNIGHEVALESNFTAVNLDRMCGVRVEWTCQLEEHLSFDVESRAVSVYSLSKCLQDHLEWLVKLTCRSFASPIAHQGNATFFEHSLPELEYTNRTVPSALAPYSTS
ncbi:hypothetical protein ACMFMG_009104 [Clarireedia jacksonii]